jgi:hypothetical protein
MKCTGQISSSSILNEAITKKVKRDIYRFHLIPGNDQRALLMAYQKRSGRFSHCIQKKEVEKVMKRLHDNHGHYADRIRGGIAVAEITRSVNAASNIYTHTLIPTQS